MGRQQGKLSAHIFELAKLAICQRQLVVQTLQLVPSHTALRVGCTQKLVKFGHMRAARLDSVQGLAESLVDQRQFLPTRLALGICDPQLLV